MKLFFRWMDKICVEMIKCLVFWLEGKGLGKWVRGV